MVWDGFVALAAAILQAQSGAAPAADELVVTPGEPVEATIESSPARLLVGTGLNRLTLDPAYVAAHGIKPAPLVGKAVVEIAGRETFKGYNRPLDFAVAGKTQKSRAFWFPTAPAPGADGRIGPMALPQARITFALRTPLPGETVTTFPMIGGIDRIALTVIRNGVRSIGVAFDVDSSDDLPVATAAAGAAIADTLGGTLSGPSWDVDVSMGVMRPVRLLTLERPLVIGPLSFTRIAVRVRDRVDAGGRGARIADADDPRDPSEIVVEAPDKKAVRPLLLLTIPRKHLAACSRLRFDKPARKIELACTPPTPQ